MRRNSYCLPITLYCVRYDPYYCTVDPEYLWSLIQAAGGSVHSGLLGCFDFYVPERIIAMVMLTDIRLKIIESKSYL
jgi:hypothetical protein